MTTKKTSPEFERQLFRMVREARCIGRSNGVFKVGPEFSTKRIENVLSRLGYSFASHRSEKEDGVYWELCLMVPEILEERIIPTHLRSM
ncbi:MULTISPECIES: hypothetical protein [unclassified Hahella]|uniref:hypothetical protein n=1 Tax=unclassified Hahella TaxID=2624107 RepID=UPI001C1EF569|nr:MULTISPECIES: hypothetical protein [unclassified Hahella]MBU6951638.1 hypothetical protein [Hahella sp. HN01]MDG9666648.1 hypothetical protein [Hahella sp. CR1]